MNFNSLLLVMIFANVKSFLFEIEIPSEKKKCVFEDFAEGENLSVRAFLFDD